MLGWNGTNLLNIYGGFYECMDIDEKEWMNQYFQIVLQLDLGKCQSFLVATTRFFGGAAGLYGTPTFSAARWWNSSPNTETCRLHTLLLGMDVRWLGSSECGEDLTMKNMFTIWELKILARPFQFPIHGGMNDPQL